MALLCLKFIWQYTSQMKNTTAPYEEHRHSMTNLFIEQFQIDDHFNEHMAEKSLMAITDDQEIEKNRVNNARPEKNSTEIARWNNYHLNILNHSNQRQRKKIRFNLFEQRHISSQNSYIDCSKSHFSVAISLKKQLNKLHFPLKEKMLNLDHFNLLQVKGDKSKTRNEVKLDIINSKHQIKPLLIGRKKIALQNNCETILKGNSKVNNYKKIKRRGFHTLQLDQDSKKQENILFQLSRTRQKSFFLPSYEQNSHKIKLRGNSIHHLLLK